jgi:hypothetical protein
MALKDHGFQSRPPEKSCRTCGASVWDASRGVYVCSAETHDLKDAPVVSGGSICNRQYPKSEARWV